MIRRFTHKQAFMDNTDYMEYDSESNTVYRITVNGDRIVARHWNLKGLIECVDRGAWKELPVDD